MVVPGPDRMSVAAFFKAIVGREGRFELVNGIAYAMAGAKQGHNVICSNVQTALVPAGKAKGCRTTSADTAIQTGPDSVRYPDVVVDCGPYDPAALTASRPTLVVEVSSPGTAVFDYGAKLREYQALDSIDTVLQIESEFALVKVHRRRPDGRWSEETVEQFGRTIDIPSLGTSITLDVIYDTVDVRPRARLHLITDERG